MGSLFLWKQTNKIHDVILSLSKSERSAEDQALLMFCAITRGQWFNDGNKRTALMAANHVLINADIGVFAISPSLKRDFTNRLLRYYESDDPAPLCAWLRDYAIGRLPEGLTSAESRRLETERIKSGATFHRTPDTESDCHHGRHGQ